MKRSSERPLSVSGAPEGRYEPPYPALDLEWINIAQFHGRVREFFGDSL
jgi:hypothetical protein